MMMENPTLTFGEKAVGKSFNPSFDPRVDKVKALFAEIIDLVNDVEVDNPSYLFNNIKGQAIREAMGAQMWAVKLVTFKN
jgi:hypothetical protein